MHIIAAQKRYLMRPVRIFRLVLDSFATDAETQTGTDTARAVTPAGLKHRLDAFNVSGGIVQRSRDVLTTAATINTQAALNDTPPAIGDGTQILAVAHTPLKIGNTVHVRAVVNICAPASASYSAVVALFNGNTIVDASYITSVVSDTSGGVYDDMRQITLEAEAIAASLSELAFSARVSVSDSAQPAYINADNFFLHSFPPPLLGADFSVPQRTIADNAFVTY